ncbi:MAG: CPBP family intramembrane metalloprotease [Ignavibacteria bacterium]|nr:CPBP family intramembrane metalloprotease [Ignavibacteria bacterium]
MKQVFGGIILAFVFWFVIFSPITAQEINFWAVMTFSCVILTVYAFSFQKKELMNFLRFKLSDIFWGLISALILYFIFFLGENIINYIFPFTNQEIEGIYRIKEGTNHFLISFLLVFVIGPAEEIFWRGFVQNQIFIKLQKPYVSILLATLIYTFVHIWAFSFTLLIAAFVCGFLWGYMFYRFKSLMPVIISHSIWDFGIFILFPLN